MIRLCLAALSAVVARLPFLWLRSLGAPLAWLVGSALRVRRGHVEGAMARAGVTDPRREARGMYRALGASVLELLWLSRRRAGALDDVATLDPGSERLLAGALAGGKGAVLAASHTGNWELAACAMARALDLLVLVKPISVRGFDAFMREAREAHGVGLAYGEGALRRARERLARGGCVALLIDQVPEREDHVVPVDFLGARAPVDRAPASLAACAGAPLVVVAFRRTEDGLHAIEALRVLHPPSRDRRAWIEPATREATAVLDAFVRRHPRQWLWLHRRWKATTRSACPTRSSSPAAPSGAASSSAPASTRTSERPRTPSIDPAPRS